MPESYSTSGKMETPEKIGSRGKVLVGMFAIGLGFVLYLADCFMAHDKHGDVPWIFSGVYTPSPFGFILSLTLALGGLLYGGFFFIKWLATGK